MRPDTIVLIHGFWVTPRSWEHWISHYESRGFRVIAPAYPGFEVEVEALNADPSAVQEVTIPAIVEHLESVVRELDRPPILIGHSAGGAFTQILREMVSVVLTLRTYDRAAGDDLPELHELIQAVLQAVAGWGPDGSVGVFELARGSLIHNRDGRLVYQLDFAIDDQLRILA